jgi:hypothetical protein
VADLQQLITICGNDYSGVNLWTNGNSLWMGPSNITDLLNNWIYEMHQYFDVKMEGLYECVMTQTISSLFSATTNWACANRVYVSPPQNTVVVIPHHCPFSCSHAMFLQFQPIVRYSWVSSASMTQTNACPCW